MADRNADAEDFVVKLRPVPNGTEAEPIIRLRGLLKMAVRAYGFRAVSVEAVNRKPPEPSPAEGVDP